MQLHPSFQKWIQNKGSLMSCPLSLFSSPSVQLSSHSALLNAILPLTMVIHLILFACCYSPCTDTTSQKMKPRPHWIQLRRCCAALVLTRVVVWDSFIATQIKKITCWVWTPIAGAPLTVKKSPQSIHLLLHSWHRTGDHAVSRYYLSGYFAWTFLFRISMYSLHCHL